MVGAGDLVAGQDLSLTEPQLLSMWTEFKRVVMDPLSAERVPFFSAIGNHDASAARTSGGAFIFSRERKVAQQFLNKAYDQFYSPDVQWLSREGFPFFYSIRFANVGFIFIDGSSASELRMRRNWLEEQLTRLAGDSTLSARIVVGHLPLVAVAKGRDRIGEILVDSREIYQLFDRNKVDLYVSGHHHAFYPGRVDSWSSEHGTVQVALGALGNGPRALVGSQTVPIQNSITIVDLEESSPWLRDKFSLTTLNPITGGRISTFELPASLPSLDGNGGPVLLERFDFREYFP